MNLFEIIFLAIALSIDCCIVSFSQGLIIKYERVRNAVILALTVGTFQALMPSLGYFCTDKIYGYISEWSSYIVFGIFFILGMKFILEAFQEKEININCIDIKCLIILGIATSIDAMVSGVSLNLSKTAMFFPCLIIGITSFVMSLLSFKFATIFQKFKAEYLEIAGGLILIVLAITSFE